MARIYLDEDDSEKGLWLLLVLLMLVCIGLGALLMKALERQADINERTYYDKELGRTVYVEKGV